MLSPFVCGNFNNQEEDDIDEFFSPCTTPKKSSRKSTTSSRRDSKNPYSNRGLDKFSALLAELENKKQKIYTQKDSKDISLVRFVYSDSNNWKPIVVKAKDRKQDNSVSTNHVDNVKDKRTLSQTSQVLDKQMIEASNVVNEVRQEEFSQPTQKRNNIKWSLNFKNMRHPHYYLPVMMVLILLFLVMYGRSFAILCTSLGWYIVPVIKERSSSASSEKTKKMMIKKDYVRRFSEKIMINDGSSSPKSVLSGAVDNPTGLHAHRKSW